MPSAPLLPITTLRRVAPFSTRNTGSCPSSWSPLPSSEPAVNRRHPPSNVPLVTRIVACTTVSAPPVPHDEPVMPEPGGGAGGGSCGGGGGAPPSGTEHSFTLLLGFGSLP